MTSHPPTSRRSAAEQQRFHEAMAELWEQRITFNRVLGLTVLSLDPADVRVRLDMRADLVGHYLYGRLHGGQSWPRFWRRWVQIAGCALLVSIGSALMFPNSWISFGVLHGIAVMLVLGRLAAPLRTWLWPLGALCIALPVFVQHPGFDSRWTNWVGLVTRKPVTEDFVPLLPWLGVLLLGLAAGQWLLRARPAWLSGALAAPARPLALLGRWPLSFYMLHQPVLIGALLAWQALHA